MRRVEAGSLSEEEKRLFYVWFLPVLWCAFTIVSFFHSGDEHGLFVFGSFVGAWIGFFMRFEKLREALPWILLAGSLAIVPFGLILDLLRVRKRVWFILFLILVVLFFIWQFAIYGSFERMRYKHGYVAGVLVATCNLSIYCTTILSIAGGLLRLLIRLVVRKAPEKRLPSSPKEGASA